MKSVSAPNAPTIANFINLSVSLRPTLPRSSCLVRLNCVSISQYDRAASPGKPQAERVPRPLRYVSRIPPPNTHSTVSGPCRGGDTRSRDGQCRGCAQP